MKRLSLLFVLILLLVACSTTQPAPPEEVVAPPEEPADTDTPQPPPPTSTPAPPTATDTPVPGPVMLFEDNFQDELGDGWTWVREEKLRWSLTEAPGYLQILMQPYGMGIDYPHNLLLREAPEGEFEIETRLVFEPRSNYQIAALVIYQDDENAVQFGRAYCDSAQSCVGNGLYFDNFIDGNFTGDNYAINFQNPSEVYLKLHRKDNLFVAYYSEDGQNWIPMGEHINLMEVESVGLYAGQSYQPAVYAEFDYYRVYQMP